MVSAPLLILSAVAFLVGVSCPWLLAYTVGPMLPARLIEPLANAYLRIGFNTAGDKLLALDADGTYEVRGTDAKSGDLDTEGEHWTVFAGSWFAIGYDRTKDVFGSSVRDVDVEATAGAELTGTKYAVDIVRGGYDTFVDLSRRATNADFYVLAGEFLSLFQHVGGKTATSRAEDAAMHEEAGDTSAHSPLVRWGGAVTFFILSALLSLVLF